EYAGHHQGDPQTNAVKPGQIDRLAANPWQRLMRDGKKTRCEGRQNRDQQDLQERQRNGGDGDGSEEQDRERVFEAAGQIEQGGELKDIESQKSGGWSVRQPQTLGRPKSNCDIQQRRNADDDQTKRERQRKLQEFGRGERRRQLAEQSQPSKSR